MNKELENSFRLALDNRLSELFSHNCSIAVPEDLDYESEITKFVDEIIENIPWRKTNK